MNADELIKPLIVYITDSRNNVSAAADLCQIQYELLQLFGSVQPQIQSNAENLAQRARSLEIVFRKHVDKSQGLLDVLEKMDDQSS